MPRRTLLLILLVLAALAAVWFLPIRGLLVLLLVRLEGAGPWGAALVAMAYVPVCVLLIPGWILSVGAGFLYGVPLGTAAVSAGSVAGASAAFLMGRTLARGWIEARVAQDPRFKALDEAVGREGFKIVFLSRLSPVLPFNILNYAFGATRVPFKDYVLASWIGMLPVTVMYVYLGSAARNLSELLAARTESSPGRKAFFALGLLATVAVTVLVTRLARKALKEAVPEASAGGGPEGGARG